jgi:hypothetical protein
MSGGHDARSPADPKGRKSERARRASGARGANLASGDFLATGDGKSAFRVFYGADGPFGAQ